MANTYGGYIVIGVEEDGKGNLVAVNGVNPERGNKQKLIQWCYDGISPILIPVVKEIAADDSEKVFYVIYVQQSLQAPHFINNRKGCYIRTDEFSQRFEPHLATYEEIRFLMNQREDALSLRNEIISRARIRFGRNTSVNHRQRLDYFATMSLAITPYFPGVFSMEINDLKNVILNSQLKARGNNSFPGNVLKSAFDSYYHDDPRAGLAIAYFEATVQGLLFYGQSLANRSSPESEKKKISSRKIFGWLIYYLNYANNFYKNAGYDGALYIDLFFDRLEGTKFTLVRPELNGFDEGKQLMTELDHSIHIVLETDTRNLQKQGSIDEIIIDLVRRITHAFGWVEAFSVSDDVIILYVEDAKEYLGLAHK